MEKEAPTLANRLWMNMARQVETRSIAYIKGYFSSAMDIGVVLFDRQRKLRWAGPSGLKKLNSLGLTLES